MNYRNVKISQDARIAKWKRYELGVILLEYGIQIQFHTQESFDVKMNEKYPENIVALEKIHSNPIK